AKAVDRHRLAVVVPLPSLDQLLSILEGMPSLEVLILGYCLPRPDSLSRVALPRRLITRVCGHLGACFFAGISITILEWFCSSPFPGRKDTDVASFYTSRAR
ncbi:hypothetical protein BJV78DRAFT_1260388, partial [Lactifluus subvellereus]